MNADGFELIRRMREGDSEVIKDIERCADYGRTRNMAELIRFRAFTAGKDKLYTDEISAFVLRRLLDILS